MKDNTITWISHHCTVSNINVTNCNKLKQVISILKSSYYEVWNSTSKTVLALV